MAYATTHPIGMTHDGDAEARIAEISTKYCVTLQYAGEGPTGWPKVRLIGEPANVEAALRGEWEDDDVLVANFLQVHND